MTKKNKKEKEMTWQQIANQIVENINQALQIMSFELYTEKPPKIYSVGGGIFKMKAFDRTWVISITPENLK